MNWLNFLGIGRKSANIILSDYFNKPVGIAVDTHVHRLSNRIGFSASSNVYIIEKTLLKKIPSEMYKNINHILVEHGKTVCTARKPNCDICCINYICKKNI